MATRTGHGTWIAKSTHQWDVTGLLNTDITNVHSAPNLPDKTISVWGTFGAGGTIQIEGDNSDGSLGIVINDANGNACSFTQASTVPLGPSPKCLRARVVGGDGTTNLSVTIMSTKAK